MDTKQDKSVIGCTLCGADDHERKDCNWDAAQSAPDEREAVTLQQVLIAYGYATDHPDKYLRGTTNWCAAFAHSLNGQRAQSAPAYNQGFEDGRIQGVNEGLSRAEQSATAGAVPEGWRCFYCGEHFTDEAEAALHFGTSLAQVAACKIDIAEYRAMEARMHSYNEEDAAIHRQMARMETDHHLALRREEEKGYARGLRDAAPQPAPKCATCSGIGIVGHSELCPECGGATQPSANAECWACHGIGTAFTESCPKCPAQTAARQEQGDEVRRLREALEFYANGDHLLLADPDAWDACSGEPMNFLHDEAGTASVEDGSIAKQALAALSASVEGKA